MSPTDPFSVVQLRIRNGSCCPRVCENPQEPISWRIVFSIALFPIAATALSLLRLAKSRRIFYAQIECLCFHTGLTKCGRFPHDTGWTAVDPKAVICETE